MAQAPTDTKPHSAAYFGDYRDFWWNRDFLELMATRLRLGEARAVLDAGCGVGHWGRLLAAVTPDETQFVGVDREPQWVAEAQAAASEQGLGARLSYREGDVHRLPFDDASFDVVTCQTLLIHVADPVQVLSEMLRVLTPAGLLLVAEPNNLIAHSIASSASEAESVEHCVAMFELALRSQRGRTALGQGNVSLGDLLPGYFGALGLGEIHVYLSDKAVPLFPPYASPEQRANVEQIASQLALEATPEHCAEQRQHFLAGGGTEEAFEALWQASRAGDIRLLRAVEAQRYHTGGACVMYLVSGRKPR